MSNEYVLTLAKHLAHAEVVYNSQVLDLQRQQNAGSGTSKQPAVKFEKPSLHPVQRAGGLKSLLQLWSGYGKANLLACPFYLLSVIYSMYNTSSL